MSGRFRAIGGTIMGLLLVACSSVTTFEQPDLPVTINDQTPKHPNATSGKPPTSTYYSMEQYTQDLSSYDAAVSANNLTGAQLYRDKMAYAIMADIDYSYGQYKGHVHLGRSSISFVGDIASIGVSAATTVAGGSALKSILGAAGTAIQGANQAYSNDFWGEKATEAIVSAMDAVHNTQETAIINSLKTLKVDSYPWGLARVQLIELFYSSTREAGLCKLEQDAATNAASATDARTAAATNSSTPSNPNPPAPKPKKTS